MRTIKDKLEKRKRLVVGTVIGLLAISVAGSMFLGLYSLLKTSQGQKKTVETQIQKESKLISEKDWKLIIETRLSDLEKKLISMEKMLQELNKKLQEKSSFSLKNVKPKEEEKKEEQTLPPIKITFDDKIPPPPKEKVSPPPPIELGTRNYTQKKEPPQFEEVVQEDKDKKGIENKEEKKEEEKLSIYIPMGFAKALLLNGVDAPTLQYGRENPHPVLMLLLDKQILANNRKLNLKGCFVMGTAFGELSSERAYIKLSRISCISQEGKIYQKKVEGVVIDEDGKTGLKGRLVSKFGSVLAKQFMAGILEGISRILQASYTTVQISPIGTTSTINPEDVTKVSIASGFGSAARKLADFYISLAKEYFPVIEIQAGRRVSVFFYGGEKLEETADFNPGIGGRL